MRRTRTSIEKIRREDLVEAAYQTFLEYGLSGMTMARIGERAGMSHGIVNYYFKTKDALLSAVVRKANVLITQDAARGLRQAATPRERLSAIVNANFSAKLFTTEIARAWVSYCAAIGKHPEFEQLQTVVDRRLASNLIHALKQAGAGDRAPEIASTIAILIDGIWIRHAKSTDQIDGATAIARIEAYIDQQLTGT